MRTRPIASVFVAGVQTLAIALATGCQLPGHSTSPPAEGSVAAVGHPKGPSDAAATIGDRAITLAELDALVGNRLLRLRVEEYKLRRPRLPDLLATAALEREAARRQLTVKALLEQEVEQKVRPVSEEEAAAVYESARDRIGVMGQPEAMRAIAESMRRQRVTGRRDAFTRELMRASDVRVLLASPRITVDASDDPSHGPEDAAVTIVEFSDFQCPYCAQMAGVLREVEAQYAGTIRLVFRDFPLPMHKDAPKAAEAAACAADQRKYWAMHDRLFAGQKALARDDLLRYAAEAGLDIGRFSTCLDSGRYAAEWQADRADGERYGVTGTPALFVNGRPLFGAVTAPDLAQVIDEELGRLRDAPDQR